VTFNKILTNLINLGPQSGGPNQQFGEYLGTWLATLAQNGPRPALGLLFGVFWAPFWRHLGSNFGTIWSIVDTFFNVFQVLAFAGEF